MATGNAKFDVAEHFAMSAEREGGAAAQVAHFGGGVVGIFPAIGDRVVARLTEPSCTLVFSAVDQFALGLLGQSGEDFENVIEIAVVVEVLGFNVENDRMLGVIKGEGAVAFVTFGNHQLTIVRPMGIGAQNGNFRADVVTGFEPGFAQQVGGHRGGGGLAVGARDDQSPAGVENGAETFSAQINRNAGFLRGFQSGVVRLDGRGHHHHIDALHCFGSVG